MSSDTEILAPRSPSCSYSRGQPNAVSSTDAISV